MQPWARRKPVAVFEQEALIVEKLPKQVPSNMRKPLIKAEAVKTEGVEMNFDKKGTV